MSWAMTWPLFCHVALLLSTATQKMTPLSLMRTTGQINSFCLLPTSLLSFLSAFFDAFPSSPTGGRGGKKELQGSKAFPEATKDKSKCFLQISMCFPAPLVRPHGAPEGQ